MLNSYNMGVILLCPHTFLGCPHTFGHAVWDMSLIIKFWQSLLIDEVKEKSKWMQRLGKLMQNLNKKINLIVINFS